MKRYIINSNFVLSLVVCSINILKHFCDTGMSMFKKLDNRIFLRFNFLKVCVTTMSFYVRS